MLVDTIILCGNCPSVVAKIRLRGITDDIRSRNIKNEIAVKYPVS